MSRIEKIRDPLKYAIAQLKYLRDHDEDFEHAKDCGYFAGDVVAGVEERVKEKSNG